MKEKKPPYVPTRTCPHRWCKTLHLIPIPFFLAGIAFEMWHNWRYLVLVAVAVVGSVWVPRIVHFKRRPRSGPVTVAHVVQDLRESPSVLDLEMQDAKYAGTGWRMLEVRKGWARVAVACDLYLVTVVGLTTVALFGDTSEGAEYAESMRFDGVTVISFVIGLFLFGFNLYAHKKATQPRKPKRAWLPAALRTQS